MLETLVFTAIAAVTELYKRVRASDWEGVITICVAALVGGLGAHFGLVDLTVVQGVIAGLGVAGIHQIARQVG